MPIERVIIGSGYTGSRVLSALGAGRAIGFRRSADTATDPAVVAGHDLDGDLHGVGPQKLGEKLGVGPQKLDLDEVRPRKLSLPDRYSLLYTVPPGAAAADDARLERLMGMLQPLPERFVYLSTSGVYGDCGGRLVNESTPPNPQTSRAKRRLSAEQHLQAWTSSQGVSLVVLRVPGIYGPDRLGLEGIREARPVLIDRDANPGNRIHVDDLASCCVAALSVERPAGLYNVGDGDHRSSSWFTRTVARLAGLPPPPEVSRTEAEQSFSAMRLSFLGESRVLDNRKMLASLGVEPRYANAEDGIRASLAADRMLMRETLPGHRP
ncbi:MAG: NAD-dependent epimerase/dehydratase family protein [Woeseia sp.]